MDTRTSSTAAAACPQGSDSACQSADLFVVEKISHSQIEQADRSHNLALFEPQKEDKKGSIKLFGHVLDAMQRQRRVSCGRVWLLMRVLDLPGEGRLKISVLSQALTSPTGSLKCLSNKRLRQILNQGESFFWHRSKDRRWVYYHSEARIAARLGLRKIGGWAVEIPVLDLLKPIKMVRSLFYDGFHSARGEGFNEPITRQVMSDRGSGDQRTQRGYESIRQIESRSNFAIVGKYEKTSWHQHKAAANDHEVDSGVGGPTFLFIDYRGILGKNGGRNRRQKSKRHWHHIYLMRQIANAYSGTLETAKRGRRWTNHKLKHLCQSMSSSTGSTLTNDLSGQRPALRFYHRSQAAVGSKRSEIDSVPLYFSAPTLIDLDAGHPPDRHSTYWQDWSCELLYEKDGD